MHSQSNSWIMICVASSKVDCRTSSPSDFMLKSLLTWLTWAVADQQNISCFLARISLTRVAELYVGSFVVGSMISMLATCWSMLFSVVSETLF